MQCRSSRWFLSHACYFSFGVIASYIEKCVGNVFPSFKSFLHSDNRQENRREREMWDKFMRRYSAFPLIISNLFLLNNEFTKFSREIFKHSTTTHWKKYSHRIRFDETVLFTLVRLPACLHSLAFAVFSMCISHPLSNMFPHRYY